MRHCASSACIVENSNGLGKVNANPVQMVLDLLSNETSAFNELIGMDSCIAAITYVNTSHEMEGEWNE